MKHNILEIIKKIIHELAERPVIFNLLRRILEFNYRGEKRVIRDEITVYDRVLDLGCGTGELCKEFISKKYVGIDLNDLYIRYAKEKYPDYIFETMDATQLQFSDNSFDTILISGVLHHCNNEVAMSILKEVHRVLTPNGKVIIWEDALTCSKMNIVGRVIQKLDEGEHILDKDGYLNLFHLYFWNV